MRQPKVWSSIVILLVIGLHAVPVLSYQGNRQTRWPILAWAMYARPIPPGPIEMRRRRIFGLTSSGQEELVTTRLVGTNRAALRNTYLNPMSLGDSTTAQQLLRVLNRGRSDPFVEVRLEGERHFISGDSLATEKLPALTYKLNPSELR